MSKVDILLDWRGKQEVQKGFFTIVKHIKILWSCTWLNNDFIKKAQDILSATVKECLQDYDAFMY